MRGCEREADACKVKGVEVREWWRVRNVRVRGTCKVEGSDVRVDGEE